MQNLLSGLDRIFDYHFTWSESFTGQSEFSCGQSEFNVCVLCFSCLFIVNNFQSLFIVLNQNLFAYYFHNQNLHKCVVGRVHLTLLFKYILKIILHSSDVNNIS